MYIGHYLYSFHAHGTLFCALSVRTITLDTLLKHPQIINMEIFSKNKLTLNNLDDRITFMYQYAWKDVWQQCSCMIK